MNVLIVAAHPDDEILGCGGTITRLVQEGASVYTLILGEGITARDDKRNVKKRYLEIEKLKKDAEKANGIIGIKKIYFYDFPDNRFDTVPLIEIIKVIENVKKEIKPDTIFTHHPGDLNIDHQLTFKAVLTASRPTRGETVKEIYSFEAPSSTEWNFSNKNDYFMPNYFVDIEKTIDYKIRAIKEYGSEINLYPHPRSPKALAILAKRWGIQVGLEAAEAFEIVRSIK
jgi:LmbE family N-acetylglucosaminyl deacetylase